VDSVTSPVAPERRITRRRKLTLYSGNLLNGIDTIYDGKEFDQMTQCDRP
jgi:hypothetical protein